MSGRIRSLKPEILDDERTAGLSCTAFRLFVACILMADDYGNFRARVDLIRSRVFWARRIAPWLVTRAWSELVAAGLIEPYEHNGQAYAHVAHWERHQRVDHPSARRLPPPPAERSTQPAERSAPPTAAQVLGRMEADRRQDGYGRDADARQPITEPHDFRGPIENPREGLPPGSRLIRDQDQDQEQGSEVRENARTHAREDYINEWVEPDEPAPPPERESGVFAAAPQTAHGEPDSDEPMHPPPGDGIGPPRANSAAAMAPPAVVVGELIPPGAVRHDLVWGGRHVVAYGPPAPAAAAAMTGPPNELPITQEFSDACVMEGLPRPTAAHVSAMFDWYRNNGRGSADWYAALRSWLRKEVAFGNRWGGPMKSRMPVVEIAPPPEPISPEELAKAPKTISQMTKKERREHSMKMALEQLYGRSA